MNTVAIKLLHFAFWICYLTIPQKITFKKINRLGIMLYTLKELKHSKTHV